MSGFEQLFRILLQIIGGFLLGDAVANSEVYQAAAGGLVNIGVFTWWYYKHRKSLR